MDSSGPTLEDVERTERWKTWIESYFEEIGKVVGPTDSKGAQGSEIGCFGTTPSM